MCRRVPLLAVLILGGCGSAAEVYRVPSGSMLPTLKIGQSVSVSVDPHYVPRVGDVVVFHPPSGADAEPPECGDPIQGAGHSAACSEPTAQESVQTFIKRIVAGPGDRFSMIDGRVYRNGLQEQDSSYTEPCGSDPSCTFRSPITIPPGDYFVLGDNLPASDDSRFWGPVPKAWIIGKVQP